MAGQTLTILFTDLVDSTGLASRLGPDRAEELRKAHTSDLRSAVERQGGEVLKGMGDGILAVFASVGAALDAAVAIQQSVARRSAREEPLAVRVGVATGEVTRDEGDVHGPAVVLASRLCGAADAGQVVIAEVTRVLLGGAGEHTFAPLGDLRLKGIPETVVATELQWEPAINVVVPFPSRMSIGSAGELIGRWSELADVWTALDTTERTMVALAGEPGIGKTRLAAEIAAECHAKGSVVLFGRCDDGAPALVPIAAMLDQLVSALGPDEVKRRAGDLAFALGGLAPALMERGAAGDLLLAFDAVDVVLSSVSDQTDVVIVLDDAHWADESTLQAIRHVLRSTRGGRLHVLTTYRDTDLSRTHPFAEALGDLRRDGVVVRVHLSGLDVAAVGGMIEERAGHAAADEFIAAVHEETAGNPFFVGEVLTHLAETGAVARNQQGQWQASRRVDELGIPEGVREVVGRRLSRLTDATNSMLRVGAVVGPEFDLDVVGRAGALAGDDVANALEESVRAGLLIELGPGRAAFRHALIRQTLLEELSATRRVQLHWRIADALSDSGADPADIAHHATAGVLAGDALVAVRRAADAAESLAYRLAFESAMSVGQAALDLMDERQINDLEARYQIHFAMAEAAFGGYGLDQARVHYLAAAAIARELDDPERFVSAAILSTRWFRVVPDEGMNALLADALEISLATNANNAVRLLALRSMHRQFVGEDAGAAADAAEAASLAERDDIDPAVRTVALELPILAAPLTAPRDRLDVTFGFDVFGRNPATYQAIKARHQVIVHARCGDRASWDDAVAAYNATTLSTPGLVIRESYEFCTYMLEGRLSDAKALMHRQRERLPEAIVSSINYQVTYEEFFRAIRVDEGRTDILLERLPFFAEAFPHFTHLRPCLASQFASVGRLGEALEQLALFRQAHRDGLPRNFLTGPTLRHLGEAAVLTGDVDTIAWMDPILPSYAGEMLVYGFSFNIEGAVDRCRAQCALLRGELDAAVELFEEALALEEEFRAPALAARTRYWLANTLLERRAVADASRARELLSNCAAFAEHAGMRLLHEQAVKLLE